MSAHVKVVQLAMDMMVTFIDIHFRALFTMPKAMKAMKAMKKAKKDAAPAAPKAMKPMKPRASYN